MNIRPALLSELDAIMPLYDRGRAYMRQNGNENQWINGYPQRDMVAEDIRLGHLYIAEEAGETAAVFCYFCGKDVEPTYRVIDGAWVDNGTNSNPALTGTKCINTSRQSHKQPAAHI